MIGKSNSLAAFESSNGPSLQNDAPNSATCDVSPREEFLGFASPNDVKQSGEKNYNSLFR